LNINTEQVLKAARTKWNFLDFKPGLVGGHCIGVDPYYLIHRANQVNVNPQIISAARQINEATVRRVITEFVARYVKNGVTNKNVLILGVAFKENCGDLRNSKAITIVKELCSHGFVVDVVDPLVNPVDFSSETGLVLNNNIIGKKYGGVIVTVSHDIFLTKYPVSILKKCFSKKSIFFDLKETFPEISNDFSL